ncbi:DUF805 domain-containing protein [Bacillus sp. DX1.1]|uniref:DUF805 domain-containing protein n=1 Tax=unclassified Bacillus (in: firmicutes) TaxID=185979 RepID=UPI0025708657|nr:MULTISPECIES: DUF805 domain-containing protein [unclassified Bacillus (in: firmicutes)]MDM5153684.1 DUF805 domain-containing protein [Bacillus sp. DX1.1]WJE82626.1 DUF805 domain-containing protein [Bacillus sp. DX3.1]
MQWYLKALKNYVGFQGRACRKEYWIFTLVNFITFWVLVFLGAVFGDAFLTLGGLYVLVMILPTLAVGARRLHDIGKTGWWQLLVLIYLIGDLILLAFYILESQEEDNKYGPNPKFDVKH